MEQIARQTSALLGTTEGLLVLALGAIAGLILGLLLAAFAWKRRDDNAAAGKLAEVQAELDEYRDEVNQHFSKTADLVNRLTDDYREVYNHLASSSAKLCPTTTGGPKIGFDDGLKLAASATAATIAAEASSDNTTSDEAADKPAGKTADQEKSQDPTSTPENSGQQEQPEQVNETSARPEENAVAASIPEKIATDAKQAAKSA